MRHFALCVLVLGIGIALGCGKKPAPAPAGGGGDGGGGPPDDPAAARNALFAKLKSNNQEAKRNAAEDLSWLAEDDAEVLPALVELLKDKGTAGAGRTLANQINSTREAAAFTLLRCGKKGESVLKEKGLPVLRDGLNDPSAVVREHTAYTVGQLGVIGKPLAPDVQKLCTDKDANIRGVAFDTLRIIGVADPVAMSKLLKHDNEEVVRLAAELIALIPEMPEAAVAPLTEALASENSNVRAAAAEGLAIAGPKAAPAAQLLADTIRKSYPAEYDPKTAQLAGPEAAYWKALGRAGESAVGPTAKLLEHTNVLVRSLAARTLGEIGPPAKSATEALKKALGDRFVNVAVEAAVALCRLGEGKDDAVNLVKRALDAPNEGVAAAAIEGITRMGKAGKPLVPLALAKLTDLNPNTRYAAVWLVGRLDPTEATKAAAEVGKLATDAEPEIRRMVAWVLEKLGPGAAPAAEALGKALPDEKEVDIRDQYVEALVAMGPGAKPALPGLLPLVSEKGLPVQLRVKAANAVAVADPASPEVAGAIVKAAADGDQTVRAGAAAALGKLDPLPPDALNTLVKMAKGDGKNAPRVAALRAMAAAGPRAKPAKAELDAIANGPQPGLALWAKVALAAIDGDVGKSASVVRAALNEKNAPARSAAAESLLLVGPKLDDLPALMKLLKDVSGTTKAAAATAVGLLGAPAKDAVPHLVRLLDDREAEVRVAAADALGRIGPDSLPALPKLKELTRDRFDTSGTRLAAQRAIERIEKK
jgi:HEAT repeat protein